ncbi:FHA domain-containing protein [Persicimonas caeni]|uniref:FHA domain-containing protein n=1 Tax=Persicimonas caeni TaxID=2292766 RepID=A0A4Y6PSG2_PERCE|nr:FHA domain-containing protein [Persicimonas caeni]QDG51261.1 FHA domain-containing protein [Persicimonas caeni]QED32482.1 FHA domain-containing protein [Persicimonas caeni]
MYKLVIADDEGSKSTVPIVRDEITIGRQEGNTIRLTERNVSRKHARVLRENGRVYVEEVAARYGIKKNGVKIDQRAEFAPGDIVAIGDYKLTLKAKKPEKAPGEPPKPAQKPKTKKQSEGTQVLPAMPAKLVVISSNFAGQEFPLNRNEMIIGRGEDCDIIIDHRSVSQKHAKVLREQGSKYQIVDLNSKNGVSVSGEQYRAVHIKRGDVIELGHVKFRFVEPGENYVFTPQPTLDDVEFDSGSSSSSKNGMMIAAVLVVAALVGGAIFFLMGDDGTPSAEPGGDDAVAVADNGAGTGAPAAPTSAKEDAEAAPTEEKADDKVSQAIAEASQKIQDGELDKAIGTLESAKKYLEPTPEQNDKIAELMGSAKTERPFKQDYQAAKDDIKSKDFPQALKRLSEIPKHSVFHTIYTEEGLMEQALDGAVAQAEEAMDKDDAETARTLVEEVLVYDGEHEGAKSLLERLDEAEKKVASNTTTSNSGSSSSRNSGSSSRRPPKRPSVSPEEAKELYRSAQKKIFKSDPAGAIQDCKKALKGGYRGCYRILAIAYKQMGNNGKACSNFKRYLGTNPGNAAAVQRQMEQLGCE